MISLMPGMMRTFWMQMLTVARRDFMAIVYTPTFLLFLLAPLMMLVFGALGSFSASQIAASSGRDGAQAIVITSAELLPAYVAADKRLQAFYDKDSRPIPVSFLVDDARHAALIAAARAKAQGVPNNGADDAKAGAESVDLLALMSGDPRAPTIIEQNKGGRSGRHLAMLADMVAREGVSARADIVSRPKFQTMPRARDSQMVRKALSTGTVFAMFLLTLMLAGQSVGMMTEEKTNKVIEVLAASAPLEAVFFGKLMGMLAVAVLFIGFWVIIAMGAAFVVGGATLGGGALAGAAAGANTVGSAVGTGGTAAAAAVAAMSFAPAVGWAPFLLLCLTYFLLAFLLLGAVFLGIGALAGSVREVQMLSLPITFFQVGMFSLATAAAGMPGSTLATVAQIFPYSSPFAMAARASSDATLWPHLAAILWQILWVGITIWGSVKMFRAGALRSGSFRWPWQKEQATLNL